MEESLYAGAYAAQLTALLLMNMVENNVIFFFFYMNISDALIMKPFVISVIVDDAENDRCLGKRISILKSIQ